MTELEAIIWLLKHPGLRLYIGYDCRVDIRVPSMYVSKPETVSGNGILEAVVKAKRLIEP